MKHNIKSLIILFAMMFAATGAQAQNADNLQAESAGMDGLFNHLSVGASAGLTGLGVDVAVPVHKIVTIRAGFSGMPIGNIKFKAINTATEITQMQMVEDDAIKRAQMTDKVELAIKPRFWNFYVLGEVHPFSFKQFYFSGGLFIGSQNFLHFRNTNDGALDYLYDANQKIADYMISPEQMKLSTDERGNLLRDGRLFFPIAWYHVSRAQGVTAEDRAECLEYAATYGYNTILMLTYATSEDDAFMDEAARLGIAVFCDVRSYQEIQEKATRWPAVVSWMHELDEPEHWGHSPEEVRRNADKIFSLAPGCPTFSSMETVATIQRYAGVTDIYSTTGYPVPACPLRLVSDKFRLLVKLSKQYGFIPMGTVQCFGYPGCQGEGYPVLPTPRQVRNMVYQALAANLKGLNFYTYSDGNFRLRKHLELDELMRKIPSEITPLLPFLQHGDYEELLQGDAQGIVGARWTMGTQTLQLWINTTNETVALSSPEWQEGFAPVNGSQGRPAKAILSLAPEEVVIWRR